MGTKYESESARRPKQNLTKQAMRKCLGFECGGVMFKSFGYGNRLCPKCTVSSRVQASSPDWNHVYTRKGAAL